MYLASQEHHDAALRSWNGADTKWRYWHNDRKHCVFIVQPHEVPEMMGTVMTLHPPPYKSEELLIPSLQIFILKEKTDETLWPHVLAHELLLAQTDAAAFRTNENEALDGLRSLRADERLDDRLWTMFLNERYTHFQLLSTHSRIFSDHYSEDQITFFRNMLEICSQELRACAAA